MEHCGKLVLVAVNPHAGSGRGRHILDELQAKLIAAGFIVQATSDVEELVGLVDASKQSGRLRAVVAAGGDGTVGLLANRLPQGIPISVLPMGTENLLAKHFGLTPSAEALVRLLQNGEEIEIDVGQANGRLFLIMAGIGFDADVVHRLHRNRKGFIRHASYFRPIWEAIRQYRYPPLKIRVDGEALNLDPTWAFVFNVPRYAMNLQIVPEANARDGKLDLRTFRKGKLWNGLWYLVNVALRRHQGLRDASYRQGTRIQIDSELPVPLQLDGDPAGWTPVEIRVLPGRLKLLLPVDRERH